MQASKELATREAVWRVGAKKEAARLAMVTLWVVAAALLASAAGKVEGQTQGLENPEAVWRVGAKQETARLATATLLEAAVPLLALARDLAVVTASVERAALVAAVGAVETAVVVVN